MQSRRNMASNVILLLLVIFLSSGLPWTTACFGRKKDACVTDTCRSARKILNFMDKDMDPCDNFYKFTCGKFLRKNSISDIEPHRVVGNGVTFTIRDQLRKILEEKSSPNDLRAFKLAKNFYKACNNKAHVAEKGLKPLLDFVTSLGGWPVVEGDKWAERDYNWTETVSKMNDVGFAENFLIESTTIPHPNNKTKQLLKVFPPSHHYWRNDNYTRSVYYNEAIEKAVLLGADRQRATEELETAFRFEDNLTKNIPEAMHRDEPVEDPRYPIGNLTALFPNIPWEEYYRKILKIPKGIVVDENEEIAVKDFEYIAKFHKLISSVSKRVQANYIISRIVTDFLRHDLNCVDFVSSTMFISVGNLYFRKYVKEDVKAEVEEMVKNIKKQFRIILQNADWMDDETQKHALDKMDAMGNVIKFGDQLWDDAKVEEVYKDLVLNEENYFRSYLNLTRLFPLYEDIPSSLGPLSQRVGDSVIESDYANANFQLSPGNRIVLGAGILQGDDISSSRPKYMNYGAIGTSIGHEITHAFDRDGRKYDKNAVKLNWWAEETDEKFIIKSQCLVSQYNCTVEELGLHVNGTRTLNENIADNGGIKAAYLAYREWARRNGPEPTLPDLPYSPNQMFWITVGHISCVKDSKPLLIEIITTSDHTPEEFRVNVPLSNIPEFAEDFNCPIGSKMNPKTKCVVW